MVFLLEQRLAGSDKRASFGTEVRSSAFARLVAIADRQRGLDLVDEERTFDAAFLLDDEDDFVDDLLDRDAARYSKRTKVYRDAADAGHIVTMVINQ